MDKRRTLMATANPAANPAIYERAIHEEPVTGVMTLQGAVVKTAILMVILLVTAAFTWSRMLSENATIGYGLYGSMVVGLIGGFVIGLVTIFFPRISPVTAPIYAALEGLVLGAISALFETMYSGIVIQAVGLSIGILAVLLFIYGTGVIRVTDKFRIGVVAATSAICLVYLADWIISLFGIRLPFIHETGIFGIGFSVFVVIIAALNLILDFDFIEQGVRRGAPKYMEWYGGFSLLVTLVWMYLEVLRLLAKLRSSQD
jgi:uncharacterized YccA/Bax inhibitor family protein